MDELIVNQIKYISSKRAAELTGYAKDYIGQLVRKGKLDAKRVGRSWYVSEAEIKAHAGMQEEQKQKIAERADSLRPASQRKLPVIPQTVEYVLPKTWGDIKYFDDESQTYPISDKQDTKVVHEITNKHNVFDGDGERVKIKIHRDVRVMSDVIVQREVATLAQKPQGQPQVRKMNTENRNTVISGRMYLLRLLNYFFLVLALTFVLLSIPIIL